MIGRPILFQSFGHNSWSGSWDINPTSPSQDVVGPPSKPPISPSYIPGESFSFPLDRNDIGWIFRTNTMKVEKETRNIFQLAVQRRRRLRAKMNNLMVGHTKECNDETTTNLMESLMGLLRIHVKRGVNLAVRDARSSDPYVVVKMGKQRLKTSMIKKDVNPEWNDELTLSITDPNIPIKLTVYDHDTFTKDDKMGDAEFEVSSYIEALRKHTNLEKIPNGTALSRLQPNNGNCLAEESLIYLKDGKILQDLVLRLGNVECGEVEIQLEWIHFPGSKLFSSQ
ncbi:hypothetical protein V6N13_010242 [Hibiscus sabdariffa]